MPLKKAYSYIRFSSKAQAKGKSLKRQLEATRKYCRESNLDLDESLTFQDLGVSAFRGKNLQQGELGKFMQACEDGLIPRGSAFVIENLDRLSRQRPRKVVALLDTLLTDYELEVHLTQARKVFKPESESAGEEGMDLIFAVAIAIRAAEEQETKSTRLKDAFARQRKDVAEGKQKILHTRRNQMPWWIDYDEDKNELYSPKEKKSVVKYAFILMASGLSSQKIATILNARKIPTWRPKSKIWYSARVRDLIRGDEPLGVLSATPKTAKAGRDYRIENYYPRIVSDKLAKKARDTLAKNNKKKPGRTPNGTKPINLFKGVLRIEGYPCSYTLNKNGKGGTYNGYYNGLMETAEGRKYSGTVASQVIEPLLFAVLSELKPEHLLAENQTDQIEQYSNLVARYRERLAECTKSITQITSAIEAGGELLTLVKRLSELESTNSKLMSELKDIEANAPAKVTKKTLKLTLNQIKKLSPERFRENEVRTTLRDALAAIIERIEVTRTIEKKHKGFIMKAMLEDFDAFVVDDPCKLTRQKYAIAVEIIFKAGGKRVFLRLPNTGMEEFDDTIITAKNF